MLEILKSAVLACAGIFILWKVYLFIAWNVEKALFFNSVRCYFQDSKQERPEARTRIKP